jgi:arylsulfatase
MNRRAFLGGAATASAAALAAATRPARPNVIVVLTDDQGYGDLSCHGHPVLRTPHIDNLHRESVRFTQFHSAPMCTPTRSQLLSGMDCLRNGAMSTACGRSQLREGIPTIADVLAAGGYQTGLFGKWHLGYAYPFRPMDRGFREAVYFLGFGLTGAGDHWDNDYFDPYCYRNGSLQRGRGYCTDFWFDEAMAWMDRCRGRREPFFCCLPLNAPHFPEWVSASYRRMYEGSGPAEYFGMVANIDDNMGRLEAFLRKTGLRDTTVLVFMSDNGGVAGVKTFNAGMSGGKTSLLDGGHRVPCFARWPAGGWRHGRDIGVQTQMQDILPTLVELCRVDKPRTPSLDGLSLAPLLADERATLADRMLVVQFYQNSLRQGDAAVIWNRWRLIRGQALYDIRSDPAQANNIASRNPEVVTKMRDHYERWWAGVEPRLGEFVPVHVGSAAENPVAVCCSEWQDVRCDGKESVRNAAGGPRGGPWNVLVERDGTYDVELRRWPRECGAALGSGVPPFKGAVGTLVEGKALPIAAGHLTVAGRDLDKTARPGDRAVTFRIPLKAGRMKLHGWFRDGGGADLCGAYFAYVTRRG